MKRRKCTICGKMVYPKGMGSHNRTHPIVPALTKEEKSIIAGISRADNQPPTMQDDTISDQDWKISQYRQVVRLLMEML